MLRRVVALLGVALVVAGCFRADANLPTAFVDGTSVHHIKVGGLDRSYRLYKPAGVPASAPLVVMMHGVSGSAREAERDYHWDGLADTAKFFVAYPDGLNHAWNVDGETCCGRSGREGVDDIGFIRAVVADIARNAGIDAGRVYATGMSNGGIMSYTLACSTEVFAAIGPVAGTQLNACPAPRPASVMHIHGTADRLVPYGGGPGYSVINGPSAPDVNAFWRNVDRCGAPSTTTDGPVTTSTAGCAGGRGVVLVTIDQWGHDWPDFATPQLWAFFAAHPR
ncbi:polyhydroxybutyrate depolymerase [Mycobacterium alsense]|uniref:Polyhydroxybutyrate depolymerase n=1 Tax=Mycobacterium alsense TaxID=324058 RepID=A0ABD6P069_9MYCO|nr:PHB depolymerase family esterase [Mycobacterium alsense]OBG34253.1 polyhydroxybutyrate depolymerase [Mycobacterium alsense]